MNPLPNLFASVRRTWRVIALSALGVVILAAGLVYDHNRGRFMLVPAYRDNPPYAIDTYTGQFCNPWLIGYMPMAMPYCVDLAKNWR